MDAQVDPAWLRALVSDVCGTDPGPVTSDSRLANLGLAGLDLFVCIGAIEDALAIEFPADLLPVLETVDDLLYFTRVKQQHNEGRAWPAITS